MSEPLLSFLILDGRVRQTCIGCTAILHKLGMVRVVEERPLPVANAEPGAFTSITYEIVQPYTLELCRSAIRERHVGPPAWGA